MAMRTIIGGILALVIAGILFWSIFLIFSSSSSSVDREVCRDWILLKAQSKILGKPLVGGENPCEIDAFEIKKNNEYEIQKIIANEMYDCWYQFGEGKKDFLSDIDYGNGNNWCHICSKIDFTEKIKNEIDEINFDDFNTFLATEPIPLHEEKTFYEYFYGGEKEYTPEEISSTLKTDSSIFVVFFADKRLDLWKEMWESPDAFEWGVVGASCLAGGKAGGMIGLAFGGATSIPGAIIGCASGAVLGATWEMVARKTEFVSGLYVGNAEEAILACNQ
jgi:hypothetical protein